MWNYERSKNGNEYICSFFTNIDIYTGAPVAIPVFAPVDKRPAIDESFALLESLSQNKKLAVAFDEFQETNFIQ